MKYDWKESNPKSRYIDSITEDEAKEIAYLAVGKPKYDFEFQKMYIDVNGNNIPHVKLYCKYYAIEIGEETEDCVGIFANLNTYLNLFHSAYCQKEIFEAYKRMGFS